MKRIFLLLALTFATLALSAQNTALLFTGQMNDIQRIIDKYDTEQAIDSVYLKVTENIANCEQNNWYVEAALWHNFLAQQLASYANDYTWQLSTRTAGAEISDDDLSQWTLEKYAQEIVKHFEASLQPVDLLENTDVKLYSPIILDDSSDHTNYSLLEFLSMNYLDYLANSLSINAPMLSFSINDPRYLMDNKNFVMHSITTPDKLSPQYLSLKTYQWLTKVYLKNADDERVVRITLARLSYVYEQLFVNQKDSIYEQALLSLADQYEKAQNYPEICLVLGKFYQNRAQKTASLPQDYVTALSWYEKASDYARTCVAEEARSYVQEIKMPQFQVDMKSFYAQGKMLFEMYAKNCDTVYMAIVPMSNKEFTSYPNFVKKNVVYETVIPIVNTHLYRTDTLVDFLPELPLGTYCVWTSLMPFPEKMVTSKQPFQIVKKNFIHVTNIYCVENKRNGKVQLWITDRRTGEPMEGVQVKVDSEAGHAHKYLTPANGYIDFNVAKNKNYMLSISKGKDVYISNIRERIYDDIVDKESSSIRIFTDRNIYRPSQTISYKAIVYKYLHANAQVMAQKKVVVTFSDANYQELHKDTLITNEFGSVAGEFVIPSTVPLGSLFIYMSMMDKSINEYAYSKIVKVEEYKRPQFEVNIDVPEKTYRVGSEVEVQGSAMALAGYPITDAQVSYRVQRITSFPYCYYWRYCPILPSAEDKEIAQGVVKTDAQGHFKIVFVAEEESTLHRFYPVFRYEITATVTDQNGEMHEAKSVVSVSNKTMLITSSIPEIIDLGKTDNRFETRVTNLAGAVQNTKLTCTLSLLQMPATYWPNAPFTVGNIDQRIRQNFPQYVFSHENDKTYWKEKKVIWKGEVVVSDSSYFSIPNLKKLPTGVYRCVMSVTDNFGEEVTDECYFTLVNSQKREMPIYDPIWCFTNSETAAPGEKVSFMVGSYRSQAAAYVKMVRNDTVLKQEVIHLDGPPKTYQYLVSEQDRGMITLYVISIMDGTCYSHSSTISVPFENKKIDVQFLTFRDKLHPGEKSTVKLHLQLKNPKSLSAELLATLYDASLDLLTTTNTYFFDWIRIPYTDYQWQSCAPYHYHYGFSGDWNNYMHGSACTFPSWCCGYQNRMIRRVYNKGYVQATSTGFVNMAFASSGVVMDLDMNMEEVEEIAVAEGKGMNREEKEPTPTIRSNFAETAFFLPFVQVDGNGEAEIEFTMPESLTKWKMIGLAHTKDMCVGNFEKYLHTQKEVMLVPNWPRFVYERDTLVLSAKVVNLTADQLKGNVVLQCYDAATGKPLASTTDQSLQLFAVAAQQSENISFKVSIPSNSQGITFKIVAKTEDGEVLFSDGEEVTLPVLSKRMLITEALPVYITQAGKKQFNLKLPENISSSDFYSCSFQFTPDPKWNAVLALPYLMSSPYECSEQTFNRLYANLLARDVMQQNPKLETLLQQFADSNPEAFCSKLSQDENLKQILLTETPWVMDAQNEEERIQNIFSLFNEKAVNRNILQAVRKLEYAQNSDGGWPWFSGGKSSSYITEYLLEGTGRLLENEMRLPNNMFLSKNTVTKAVKYIDDEFEERYEELRRNHPNLLKEEGMYAGSLYYLYVRSFYLKQVKAEGKGYHFFLKKLAQDAPKMQNIYLKTMAALTFYRVGNELAGNASTQQRSTANTYIKLAKQLMESVKSQAQYSEEMGMFWKKQGRGYYWYESLIERQVLLMDAFERILQDEKSVQQMKIWLLQQKRTQDWGTTKSTADACHALLAHDLQLDGQRKEKIYVKVCEDEFTFVDTLQLPFKQDIKSCIVDNGKKEVTLQRDNDALSYGAVFYQYYQDMDQISASSSDMPLAVDRDIYRVGLNERGEVLEPLDANTTLKVGDKVRVRMTISCDRDLEFVHLKDYRAAAFEPTSAVSRHRSQDGLYYYESYKDASVNFFFDWLPKGKYVFEYTLFVTQAGTFNSGYANIQCMYAPEFVSHSKSRMIKIEEE